MPNWPITFESPIVLGVAICAVVICAMLALARKALLTRGSGMLMLIGLLLLCTAAGGARWRSAREGEVAVMIDLSPSTRGALTRSA